MLANDSERMTGYPEVTFSADSDVVQKSSWGKRGVAEGRLLFYPLEARLGPPTATSEI
jgi:hypothetical protein